MTAQHDAEPGQKPQGIPIVERVGEPPRLKLAKPAHHIGHRSRQERRCAHDHDGGRESVRHQPHPPHGERKQPEEDERREIAERPGVLRYRASGRVRPRPGGRTHAAKAPRAAAASRSPTPRAVDRPPRQREQKRQRDEQLGRHERGRAREVTAALEAEVDRQEARDQGDGDDRDAVLHRAINARDPSAQPRQFQGRPKGEEETARPRRWSSASG